MISGSRHRHFLDDDDALRPLHFGHVVVREERRDGREIECLAGPAIGLKSAVTVCLDRCRFRPKLRKFDHRRPKSEAT